MAKSRKKSHKLLRKIHRYVGLASFVVLCWLSISGLFLNHTDWFKLSDKQVRNDIVLDLYNIPKPDFSLGIRLDNQWIFSVNDYIYLQNHGPLINDRHFVSALLKDDFIVVASANELLLFTQSGEYVDNLILESQITKIGLAELSVVVATKVGNLLINQDYTKASDYDKSSVVKWKKLSVIPDNLREKVLSKVGRSVSLQQVFLDAHSGRILGIAGVYFMDLMAILIILVGISGVIIWALYKIKRKRKQRQSEPT